VLPVSAVPACAVLSFFTFPLVPLRRLAGAAMLGLMAVPAAWALPSYQEVRNRAPSHTGGEP